MSNRIFKSFFRACAIGSIVCSTAISLHAQTAPIQPNIQETPLPPKVELPAPPQIPADIPNRPLTADEAAAIALFHQPDIKAATAETTAAHGRVRQAQSDLLPSASIGASYTNSAITPATGSSGGSPVSTATSDGYQVTASLRQLLFDFNHTRDLVRQESALQIFANANLQRVQFDTVYQVKQAFYIYSQNQRLVSVYEANLGNQRNHLASAQARLDAGFGLPVDVVRAQTAVAEATLNLTIARNNASIARVNLAQIMGIDPRTPIETADAGEQPMQADDMNMLVDLALKQRPEMKQAKSAISAANYGLSAAKTGAVPSLGANVGWVQRGSGFPPDRNSMTYGVSVTWTPFDSGLTKGRIEEAGANLCSAQAQQESTSQIVISDVSQAYLNLKTAEQRVSTSEAGVANAEEATRLAEGRYASGLGTFLDVLDAQNALLTAKTNLVNSQSALSLARASLSHAIGAAPH